MKKLELFSLAKDFTNSSYTYKKIIKSYTFSFVLLIIVFWLCFVLFGAIISQVNIGKNGCVVYIEYSENGYVNIDTPYSAFLLNSEQTNTIKNKIDNVEILNGTGLSFGGEYEIFVQEKSQKIMNNLIYFVKNTELQIISGKSFTSNKKQVCISEDFVALNNWSKEEIIGKTLKCVSIYSKFKDFMFNQVLDDDNNSDNITLNEIGDYVDYGDEGGRIEIMSDFIIVGVYSSDSRELVNGADIVCPYETLVDEETTYLPVVKNKLILDKNGHYNKMAVLTYSSTNYVELAKKVAEKGMIFPFILGGDFYSKWCNEINSKSEIVHTEKLLLKDYFAVKKFSNYIFNIIENYGLDNFTTLTIKTTMLSQAFINTNKFDDVFTFIIYITTIFGVITYIATLLNCYNVQAYSYRYKRKNMTINMALGMTYKDVRELFLFEFLNVFIKALKYSLIISLIIISISTLLMILLIPTLVSLQFIGWSILYYFVSILITTILCCFFGIMLTLVTSRNFSNFKISNID